MTSLNTDLIAHHAGLAQQCLAGDPDVDVEHGEEALKAVVNEHVDALLAELERRSVRDDSGYVRGLKAAARCLAAFDQDVPGLDRQTCRQLANAVQAMADSAQQRLGLDGDGPAAEALAGFLAQSSFVGYSALHEVTAVVPLRHALNEMIGALDAVAHGRAANSGRGTDRPLLPAEQEAFAAQIGGAQ